MVVVLGTQSNQSRFNTASPGACAVDNWWDPPCSEPPSCKALTFAKGWTIVRLAVPRYGTNISHGRVCFGAVIGEPLGTSLNDAVYRMDEGLE